MALESELKDSAATANAISKRDANGDSNYRRLGLTASVGGFDNLGYERGGVTSVTTTTTINPNATPAVGAALFEGDATSAAFTINLPPAATWTGMVIELTKTDSTVNAVTVDGNGAETIDGATTQILNYQYETIRVRSNGTGWDIIGWYQPVTKAVIGASTAAAGSVTGDATVLPAGTADVYPTTAADDARGVRLHAADKITGRRIFIGNGVSNKILKVYPVSGGTINGASADVAFSSVSGKGVWIVCLSSGSNTWLAA